jgi:hypothetical protein
MMKIISTHNPLLFIINFLLHLGRGFDSESRRTGLHNDFFRLCWKSRCPRSALQQRQSALVTNAGFQASTSLRSSLFQLLFIPELTPLSLLGREPGFRVVIRILRTSENDHLHIYSLYDVVYVIWVTYHTRYIAPVIYHPAWWPPVHTPQRIWGDEPGTTTTWLSNIRVICPSAYRDVDKTRLTGTNCL